MNTLHQPAALRRALIPVLLAFVLCAPRARADGNPPERMTYQGYVVDANGNILGNTNTGPKNYDVVFRIWNDQTASAPANRVWTEQQTITVDKGYFSVLLGEGSAYNTEPNPPLSSVYTNSIDASDRYVEITVLGIGPKGSASTIMPRLRLVTSPYAFLAQNAVNAANLVNSTNGQVMVVKGSMIGVNKAAPAATLDVNGTVMSTGLTVAGSASVSALGVSGAISGNSMSVNGATVGGNGLTVTGSATVTGTVTAGGFSGNGVIPVGGIIMWSGPSTSIPAGWALCDGGNHSGHLTPNLMDKFIIGAGNIYPVGNAGGSSTVTLAAANLPPHTHTYNDWQFLETGTANYYAAVGEGSAGAAGVPIVQNETTQPTGSGQAFSVMPPYYALAFIMRVQ
jgi:microcystin-dependent protein